MLRIKLLYRVRRILLFEVGFDLAELLAEFAVENLVVQDVLEVCSRS